MEKLLEAIAFASDAVENLEYSDKDYRDAVFAEAGVKTKSEYFEDLLRTIFTVADLNTDSE